MKAPTSKKSAPRESQAATKNTAAKQAPKASPRKPKAKAEAAPLAPQTPDVARVAGESTKKATRKAKAPTGEKVAKAPRAASKTSRVIEMLKREGGATLEEIMSEMSWLKHTTRAWLSAGGSLTKKHGLVVVSQKIGDQRTYSLKG